MMPEGQISAAQMLMNFISGEQRKVSRSISSDAFSREIATQQKAMFTAQEAATPSKSWDADGTNAALTESVSTVTDLRGRAKHAVNNVAVLALGGSVEKRLPADLDRRADASAVDEVELDLTAFDQILAQFGVAAETRGRLLELAGSGHEITLSQAHGVLKENAGIDLRVAATGEVSGAAVRDLLDSGTKTGSPRTVSATNQQAGLQLKSQYDLKEFKALLGRLAQPKGAGFGTSGSVANRDSRALPAANNGDQGAQGEGVSPQSEYSELILDRALPTFVRDRARSHRSVNEAGQADAEVSQVRTRAEMERRIGDGRLGSSGDSAEYQEGPRLTWPPGRSLGNVAGAGKNGSMATAGAAEMADAARATAGSQANDQNALILRGLFLSKANASQPQTEAVTTGSQGPASSQFQSLRLAVESQPQSSTSDGSNSQDLIPGDLWNEVTDLRLERSSAGTSIADRQLPSGFSRGGSVHPGTRREARAPGRTEADPSYRDLRNLTADGVSARAVEQQLAADREAPAPGLNSSSQFQPEGDQGGLGGSPKIATGSSLGTGVGGDALGGEAADSNAFRSWGQAGMQPGPAGAATTSSGAPEDGPRLSLADGSWSSQLARQFKSMQQQPIHQLVLRLEPESLGSLVLRLRTRNNKVTASITADNESTRQILLQHAPALKQQMEQQGFSLSGFSVDLGGQSNPDTNAQARSELAAAGSGLGRSGSATQVTEAVTEAAIIFNQTTPDQLVNLIV